MTQYIPSSNVRLITPSGDTSGTTDTATLAVIAATATTANPVTVQLSGGIFYVTSMPQVTPYFHILGSGMTTVINDVGVGPGSCLVIRDPNFNAPGGNIGGFYLDGTNHTGTARVGVECGDIRFLRLTDIRVVNYNKTSDIGVWLVNKTHYTERLFTDNFSVDNCTSHVVIDQIAGGSVTTSHSYSELKFVIAALVNQDGFVFQNGVTGNGCKLSLKGNFFTGTGNTGVALSFGADNLGGTWDAQFECFFETDGSSGTGHKMYLAGTNFFVSGTGMLGWLKSGTIDWQAGNLVTGTQTQFSFSGQLYHYGGTTSPDSMVPQYNGQSQQASSAMGLTKGHTSYDSGTHTTTVYAATGDAFAFALLASAAMTITFSGIVPGIYRRFKLYLLQSSSGNGTITWTSLGNNTAGQALVMIVPNGGPNPPVLQTAANAWDVIDIETYDGVNLYVIHPTLK